MKKVLIIAYLYPPIFNSGTRRSLEFVNHLPDHGWSPVVLTVAEPDPADCDSSLMNEVRAGTRIERVLPGSKQLARKAGALLSLLLDRQRVTDGLEWRIRRWWGVPDECASWVPPAVAHAVRLHGEVGFDAIYATGSPWSSFLVAEQVGRLTGVPYMLDYRDLWKPSDAAWDYHTWLQRKLSPRLERRVLRGAAGVIATTASFLKLLPQELLPQKQFAITNGYDESDFPAEAQVAEEADDTVRISYTGVWRRGYGPDDLYAAIRLLRQRGAPGLQRLRVVMAGFPPGRAAEYGISDHVEERGRVTHAEAVDMMCSASAVYLPVSGGLYEHASMPGKLFEYMGSGRPILASAKADSEVARALAHVGGACRVEPGDIAALADALAQMCAGTSGDAFTPRQPAALATYTRASLTGKLAAALDAVASPAA